MALHAVLELAAEPKRQLSAADLAAAHGASTHHLAKVLRRLGQAGLVEAVRGVGGGYRFVGNAKRLTVMDVIGLFEAIGAPAGGHHDGVSPAVRALGAILAEIDDHAVATFRSVTIATMLKLTRRLGDRASQMPVNP
ncbi:MAG: Rrf2 family transcriptional regulator [Alphaproteobacteria bacterium]|nr:Rrf2 family transcriptional regulator [Alphaproteobacteria bacterium]